MPQIISGRYQNHDRAMQAIWRLHTAGLPLWDIAVVSLEMQPTSALLRHAMSLEALGLEAEPFDVQSWWEGFLEALLCRHLAPDTLRAYTDVIRAGTYLMLVHGTAHWAAIARRVLEESGAYDIEVRITADEDQFGTPARFPTPDFPRWTA